MRISTHYPDLKFDGRTIETLLPNDETGSATANPRVSPEDTTETLLIVKSLESRTCQKSIINIKPITIS